MRHIVVPIALLLGLATPMAARAGVYSDDLSRCLVANTHDADQIVLAQWIFGIMSVHPDVASIAKVDDATRAGTSKKVASLFQTLLTDSCRNETAQAMKYEGVDALKGSFELLGKIAMNTLMGDPKVAAETQAFVQYMDEARLKAVMVPQKDGPTAAPAQSKQ